MKEYNLHSKGDNWFHFRSDQNSTMESFSITYCHDGTVCMHGDYGCLSWQRSWFPEQFDYGFPAELTGIDYFASKIVRASDSQKIREWTQENATKDIENTLKTYIEDGDHDDDPYLKAFTEMLEKMKSYEYNQHEFSEEFFAYDIDTDSWVDIGIDYTGIFKHKLKCLKSVSDKILNAINSDTPSQYTINNHSLKQKSC